MEETVSRAEKGVSGTRDDSVGREFWWRMVKEFRDLIIFDAVRKESLNGYRLIKLIHDRHQVPISLGSMYRILDKLQEQGLIELVPSSQSERKLKFYVATKKGVDLINKLFAYRQETKALLSGLLPKEEET